MEQQADKPRRGRPPGKDYPVRFELQLTEAQAEVLTRAAGRAGVSQAEMIRRAIDRLTNEE